MQVVRCPKCNTKLNLPPAMTNIRCPRCSNQFKPPATEERTQEAYARRFSAPVRNVVSRMSAPLPDIEVRAVAKNCALCGLRLTNAQTCPHCEESFCSQVCLKRHGRTCSPSVDGTSRESASRKSRPVGIAIALLLFATAGLIFFATRSGNSNEPEDENEPGAPNLTLTANDLWRKCNAGERLEGNVLQVTGAIELVELSPRNPYIQFAPPEQSLWSVRCLMNNSSKQSVAKLRVGQSVTVAGTCLGRPRSGSNVLLENCRLVTPQAKR